jgi:hypothetical protein
MKTALTYGFLMAVSGSVVNLLLFFTGLHDTPAGMQTAQWLGGLAGLAITVAGLALAMREQRLQRAGDANWSYGSAWGYGVLTGLFGGLFGAVFAYLYFGVIHPGFADVVLEMQTERMADAGLAPAQIERAEPMVRKWLSPGLLSLTQAFSGFLLAVGLSLLVAITYRRPLPAATEDLPPTLG